MNGTSVQRQELADFLRTRRARLRPSDVGLLNGTRRRTPGLRREEVALLANIGLTWYTRLEQGAAINVSPSVLGSIADALQLTEHERDHLFVLAGHRIAEATAAETAHPLAGELRLEYTSLAVPGCPDMFLIAYTTAKGSDEERKLRSLLDVDRDLAAAISN